MVVAMETIRKLFGKRKPLEETKPMRKPMKRVKVYRVRSKWCMWAIGAFLAFFIILTLAWNNFPFLFPLACCVFLIWVSLWIQTIYIEVLVNEPDNNDH
jgi:hypothetical protein